MRMQTVSKDRGAATSPDRTADLETISRLDDDIVMRRILRVGRVHDNMHLISGVGFISTVLLPVLVGDPYIEQSISKAIRAGENHTSIYLPVVHSRLVWRSKYNELRPA